MSRGNRGPGIPCRHRCARPISPSSVPAFDHLPRGVAIIGIAVEGLDVGDRTGRRGGGNWSPPRRPCSRTRTACAPSLCRCIRPRAVERIDLGQGVAPLLGRHPLGQPQAAEVSRRLSSWAVLRRMSRTVRIEIGLELAQGLVGPLVLFGMAVAALHDQRPLAQAGKD